MTVRFYYILNVCFLFMGIVLVPGAQCSTSPSDSVRVRYITVNGRQMYLEQYGHGRALVLLHGGLSTIQASFEKQIGVFSKKHHVIAIEQTGHGHTPDADIPFSYVQMARDTWGVLRSLHVKNADIIGWSDGGILALLLASHHPELVHRLVISGANTDLIGVSPEEAQAIHDSSAEELAKGMPLPETYGKVSPDGPDHWPVVVKKVWDLWLTPVAVTGEDLARVQAPVLVACGDNDVIPLEHTIKIFRSLPHAKLLVLPGTGHDTFSESADTLNPIILAFIDAP